LTEIDFVKKSNFTVLEGLLVEFSARCWSLIYVSKFFWPNRYSDCRAFRRV